MIRAHSTNRLRMIASLMVVCAFTTCIFTVIGNTTVVEAKTVAQLEKELAALEKQEKALWLLMEKNKADSAKVEKELDAAIAAAENNGSGPQGPLLWPLPGRSRISSFFGWRTIFGKRDNYTGIDIPAPAGTNILAAASGKVIVAQKANSSYGWHIVINHNGGLVSLYGRMSRLDIGVGDQVKRG